MQGVREASRRGRKRVEGGGREKEPSGRSADRDEGEREWYEVRVGRRYNIAYANSLWT